MCHVRELRSRGKVDATPSQPTRSWLHTLRAKDDFGRLSVGLVVELRHAQASGALVGGSKRATALVREKRSFADLKERERDVPQLYLEFSLNYLEDSEPLDSVGAYAAFQLVTEGRC